VLTSYLVSNAIILPISGWIASEGRAQALLHDVRRALHGQLVPVRHRAVARGAHLLPRPQGLGGGGLGPSEQSILADTFPPRSAGWPSPSTGWPSSSRRPSGPTLGGFITDHYSGAGCSSSTSRSGSLSLFLANHFVTDPPHLKLLKEKRGGRRLHRALAHRARPRDARGRARQGAGGRLVHSSFITVLDHRRRLARLVRRLGVAPRHPVVDVRLFKNRNFAVANVMMLTSSASRSSARRCSCRSTCRSDGLQRGARGHGAVARRLRRSSC
jgi:DHA2 family multidrug resistance protein